MRRLPILFLLLFAICSPLAAHAAASWHQKLAPALSEAQSSNRLVLVDLYAQWCGWCKRLEREVFATAKFQAAARDFVLLRVDVEDGGEGSRIQARYEAETLPTTLILN